VSPVVLVVVPGVVVVGADVSVVAVGGVVGSAVSENGSLVDGSCEVLVPSAPVRRCFAGGGAGVVQEPDVGSGGVLGEIGEIAGTRGRCVPGAGCDECSREGPGLDLCGGRRPTAARTSKTRDEIVPRSAAATAR
jgi:hypothetical protein